MNKRNKVLGIQADEFAHNWFPPNTYNSNWQEVRDQKFAELIRADEREACANLALSMTAGSKVAWEIVDAIRARGEVK